MAKTKRVSRRWSLSELKDMHQYIQNGLNAAMSIETLKENLARTYGVTPNAINLRYKRFLKGKSVPKKNKLTVKEPTIGKRKRGPYKERQPKVQASSERRIVLPIKDVNLDLKNGTITIIY